MEAVVFCGVQGSGKSTFFADRFFETHVRINLDMLRTRNREQIFRVRPGEEDWFVVDEVARAD